MTIRLLQEAVQLPLPESYTQLLRASDGGEWWVGDNFIRVRTADDLITNPYPFAEFVPGILFFAGDGGEALFGFDLHQGSGRVLILHTDDLNADHRVELADDLWAFFDLLQIQDWIEVWRSRYTKVTGH